MIMVSVQFHGRAFVESFGFVDQNQYNAWYTLNGSRFSYCRVTNSSLVH